MVVYWVGHVSVNEVLIPTNSQTKMGVSVSFEDDSHCSFFWNTCLVYGFANIAIILFYF